LPACPQLLIWINARIRTFAHTSIGTKESILVKNTIQLAWLAELAELRERATLACEAMQRNIDDYRLIATHRRLGMRPVSANQEG
jgi:hypothetical protein